MYSRNKYFGFLISFLLLAFSTGNAYQISGQAFDLSTGNPVADATVTLDRIDNYSITNLDGKFIIEIPSFKLLSEYNLEISHLNYDKFNITLSSEIDDLIIQLIPKSYELSQVVVSQGRSSKGAISDIDRKQMDREYSVQDVPMIINRLPNSIGFNYSGSDVGASEIRIRGFKSDKIIATVNGVPINDPEDHGLYWQNSPDFLSNTYDIQVERGVSDFSSGPASIGGGLNLVTSDAVSNRELNISLQSGSFNTSRKTLAYRSGIIGGKYNYTGRFSKVSTDGYRDHTSSDMWSYLLAAARFDSKMITRFQVYGGEEDMEAYWWGVDEATLKENRKYNLSAKYKEYMGDDRVEYHGEGEYFQQPHYMLQNQWRVSPGIELNQSLFLIIGDGYSEEWKDGRDFYEYNLAPFDVIQPGEDGTLDTVTIVETDLIRRKNVTKEQIGWVPHLNWRLNSRNDVSLGLELRKYESKHWGKVMWARSLPDGVDPQHEWYRWNGKKIYTGGYFNFGHYMLDKKLRFEGGFQLRKITFEVNQLKMGAFPGHEYELDWLFVNPRYSVQFELNDEFSTYCSFAGAGREPMDDQIYDADNPYDIPKLREFGQPEVKPEYMWDVELGGKYHTKMIEIGMNVYGMFFTNEIILTGFSSELDEEVFDNAPTSKHIGIEIDGEIREFFKGLTVFGNVSYGQAILGDYELDYIWHDDEWNYYTETLNLKGNTIGLFPNYVLNLGTFYQRGVMTLGLNVQQVSAQFMDNREDYNARLDPYTLLDGTFIFDAEDLPLRFELRVMNLLDEEYEPHGAVDIEDGTPYYVPAAGRRFLAGVVIKL